MKKAFAWLEGKGIEYRLHDYKKDGAPADRIKGWIRELGWEALLNSKGTTFRKLPEPRQKALNDAKAAALMAEYPSVIKRPVIESGKQILVGYDPALYERVLRR